MSETGESVHTEGVLQRVGPERGRVHLVTRVWGQDGRHHDIEARMEPNEAEVWAESIQVAARVAREQS